MDRGQGSLGSWLGRQVGNSSRDVITKSKICEWSRHGSRLLPTLTKVIRCQSLLCKPPSAHRPIAPAESRVMTRPRGLLEGG